MRMIIVLIRNVKPTGKAWFERAADAYLVLWWVPAGHRPSAAEAVELLHDD